MSVVNNNLLLTGDDGYRIERSLRLRSSASAFLNRTPSTASNRTTWTWSGWVKRGSLGVARGVFDAYSNDQNFTQLRLDSSNRLDFYTIAAGVDYSFETTAVFRDPSAWYHIVVVLNTTSGTQADRFIIYINGVRQAGGNFYGAFAQNVETYINSTSEHKVGRVTDAAVSLDGYLTEINFVDGQALTPSSFGEFNEDTGVWQPKAYAGTYGTNGFYLNFKNNASTSALGTDYSGNGNNWTTNNISLTAGATFDSMIDVPTPYDDGGNGRGNYCTLNPLRNTAASQGTISSGNLQVTGTNGVTNAYAAGTMAFSGKMYCEFTITAAGSNTTTSGVGVVPITSSQFATAGSMATGIYYTVNGNRRVTNVSSSYGASYTTGDVIGVAVDADAETVTFYKNNVSQGSISGTGIISAGVFPYIGFEDAGSPTVQANFGQRPFAYTPPTGFKALNTQNLPEPTIVDGSQHFDVVTRTGNNSSFSVTGLQFSPDFFWTKCRNTALAHYLADTVRGDDNILFSNLTLAEFSEPQYITAISSDGYTLGAGSNVGNYNGTGGTYVDWLWKASDSAPVTNTAGSITSTVSANPTAGFSIATFTANGVTGATVGHGLGVAPRMVIVKSRSNAQSWPVYHASLGATNYLFLDSTAASASSSGAWNNTAPTSSVFSLGTSAFLYTSGFTYVAYCFAEVAGYSRFGSYTGNGSADGPFVFCGFRPRWIMVKRADSTGDWLVVDTTRATSNVIAPVLFPNLSIAEETATIILDALSNGFKCRNLISNLNANGGTYVYAAFAEHPFKLSLAR